MSPRRLIAALVVLISAIGMGGCGFTGINDLSLPLGPGTDEEDLEVTIVMSSASNLVPNSEVRYDDVRVGTVRSIHFENWNAHLVVGLESDVGIPANVEARVGQKSLLGAQYVELLDVAGDSRGKVLADGDLIPKERTGVYPDTEKVLTAAGLLFNGGGLENLATITHESNQAIVGREEDVRALTRDLNALLAGVNAQRADLERVLDNTADLGRHLTRQRATLARSLDVLPDVARLVSELRPDLVASLEAVSELSDTAIPVMTTLRPDLVANLNDLSSFLLQVAKAGKAVVGAVGVATFPFPLSRFKTVFRGDYINLFMTLDLRTSNLAETLFAGTPLAGLLTGASPTSMDASDPFAPDAEQTPSSPDTSEPNDDPVPDLPQPPPANPSGPDLSTVIEQLLGGRHAR